MFRKLKGVVVFLKIIVSFVPTRPFGKYNNEEEEEEEEDDDDDDDNDDDYDDDDNF